eukprot:COSAG01_NODE_18320_length_1084_cov_30.264975_1_plen_350_part_01
MDGHTGGRGSGQPPTVVPTEADVLHRLADDFEREWLETKASSTAELLQAQRARTRVRFASSPSSYSGCSAATTTTATTTADAGVAAGVAWGPVPSARKLTLSPRMRELALPSSPRHRCLSRGGSTAAVASPSIVRAAGGSARAPGSGPWRGGGAKAAAAVAGAHRHHASFAAVRPGFGDYVRVSRLALGPPRHIASPSSPPPPSLSSPTRAMASPPRARAAVATGVHGPGPYLQSTSSPPTHSAAETAARRGERSLLRPHGEVQPFPGDSGREQLTPPRARPQTPPRVSPPPLAATPGAAGALYGRNVEWQANVEDRLERIREQQRKQAEAEYVDCNRTVAKAISVQRLE